MVGIRCRPEGLPFDGAFGVVLCLDVLEHVPPADRAGFVRQLARVAAERVILACPSSEAQNIDDLLVTTFQSAGTALPPWLTEHYECGLPTPAEIAEACAAVEGFRATPLAMPNGLLTTATTLAEQAVTLEGIARHEVFLRCATPWWRSTRAPASATPRARAGCSSASSSACRSPAPTTSRRPPWPPFAARSATAP